MSTSARGLLAEMSSGVSAVGMNRINPEDASGGAIRKMVWAILIMAGVGFMIYHIKMVNFFCAYVRYNIYAS